MRRTTIIRRYARALIEIGEEGNRYKAIGRELRDLLGVFSGSPELYNILLNPMYKLEERKGLVEGICENLGVSLEVKKFLSLLVETRDIRLYQGICEAYFRLEDELEGRITARVEAPVELDKGLVTGVKERLQTLTGKDIVLKVDKNPALIGGLVVRVGNVILDGSIKTQLEKIKDRLVAD